jgi:hypothetical protein
MDEQGNFEAALKTAQAVTVYWCPLIKRTRAWPRAPGRSTAETWQDLEDLPGIERAVLEDAPAPLQSGILEACTQLAGRPLTAQERGMLAAVLTQGATRRSCYELRAASFRVALVQQRLGHHWHDRLPASGTSLSFGLWEDKATWDDDAEGRWTPEINICHSFSPRVLLAGGASFHHLLGVYLEEMWQEAIYLTVRPRQGSQEAWFFRRSPQGTCFQGPYTSVSWLLHTPTSLPWHEQFRALRQELDPAVSVAATRQFLREEMRADVPGLGATFHRGGEDEAVLRIENSGGARFLFRPFFEFAAGRYVLLRMARHANPGERTTLFTSSPPPAVLPDCVACAQPYETADHVSESVPARREEWNALMNGFFHA